MLSNTQSVHFIGICGTAMASVAAALQERGVRVTGSDSNVYPPMSTFLAECGVEVREGYRKENLQRRIPRLPRAGEVRRTWNGLCRLRFDDRRGESGLLFHKNSFLRANFPGCSDNLEMGYGRTEEKTRTKITIFQ